MTLTASASTCGSPLYQFWELAPGGSWTIAQPFGASASFAWNSTGAVPGTYQFEVWVKDSASASTWDTYGEVSYEISPAAGTSCASGTLTGSPASPQFAGTGVNLLAGSSGCGTPLYQFWEQPPGGSWSIVQPFSSNSSFAWDTSASGGTYTFVVWAKDSASQATWDTYAQMSYVIDAPCSAATLSASPTSPQSAGTPVTFSSGSSTCSNPQYQYWIQPAGGAWSIARPWSTMGGFVWDTTAALGSYNVVVWVKDASSPTSNFDTYAETSYEVGPSSVGPACTAGTLSASPASPQDPGTPVNLTASSSTCSSAQYQFWELAPGGSWTVVQPFSSNATYAWTAAVSGPHRFTVWIKDSTSTAASWETYGEINFTVN